MTEVAAMQDKNTHIASQFGTIIAAAMDEGWTELDVVAEVKAMAAAETERRTQEIARKLYGPAAKALEASPSAVGIVAKAKLSRGKYGIAFGDGGSIVEEGAAARVISSALHTGEVCRLYRDDSGWRFVGIINPDGTFIDERSPH